MKKFISLALAAAMTLSLVPVSAFAATDNRITNVVTVTKDTELTSAPKVVIENSNGDISGSQYDTVEFELVLDGAEWSDTSALTITGDLFTAIGDDADGQDSTITKISDTRLLVKARLASADPTTVAKAEIQLNGVKVTGDTAKVTIDPKSSVLSADTFTFAKSASGGTIATIEKTTDFQDGGDVKDIVIEEVAPGSIEVGSNNDEIKLKLNSGFKFGGNLTVELLSGDTVTVVTGTVTPDGRDAVIDLGTGKTTTQSAMIKISEITIAEDGADFGDVAEITISGSGVTTQTLEVGTYSDFGVSVTAEDKDLPTVYSGVAVDGDNNQTLELTVKESIENSWLVNNRKTTFTFPEGVKVQAVNVEDQDNTDITEQDNNTTDFTIDGNEVTLKSGKTISGGKGEVTLTFDVVVSPDFTGDITCTVGGPAISEETEVTLAKAVAPISVEAEKTSVAIDYRNVSVGDITVKEAEAGLWEKDNKIVLKAENMIFESGITAEVVEGDGEIKDLNINKSAGTIEITVKSESSKTPMSIKLSNVSLYLDRTLPAGDYKLSLVASDNADGTNDITTTDIKDVMFQTYNEDDGDDPVNTAGEFGFDVSSVDVMSDYVTVATSGRDQGTSFTTEVKVTIDSQIMVVDGVEVDLSKGTATSTAAVPAPYLSAEGWTMVPVRAVTEALASSANKEPVSWVNGTVLISYGDRTVSMTIGSTTMYINGTPVPMNTAPVIVDGYTFIPYRDLGNALGLTSEQIVWDAATRTATFNPSTAE